MNTLQDLKIGEIIAELRKSKCVTQEKLGEAVGVSAAAVSKWENGQSYPDISLLCDLAAFFDITTDELLGYEANISKAAANAIYADLMAAFAEKPLEEALADCNNVVKKYLNSDYLHLHIANLLINHVEKTDSPEKAAELLEHAKALYKKVIDKDADPWLVHQAKYGLAISHIFAGDGVSALNVIEGCIDTTLPPEILKAHALQLIGENQKAAAVLQGYAFQCIVGLFNAAPVLAFLKANDPATSEKWISAVLTTAGAFEMERSNPLSTGNLYIAHAQLMASKQENDKALAALQIAADLLGNEDSYNEPFKEEGLFDDLSALWEHMDVGNKAPRSERVIKDSFISALTQNPAFESLRTCQEFQDIIARFR